MSKPIPGVPGIPEPRPDVVSLQNTVIPMKIAIEEVTGQRGNVATTMVTWADLLALGLITPEQMPR